MNMYLYNAPAKRTHGRTVGMESIGARRQATAARQSHVPCVPRLVTTNKLVSSSPTTAPSAAASLTSCVPGEEEGPGVKRNGNGRVRVRLRGWMGAEMEQTAASLLLIQ